MSNPVPTLRLQDALRGHCYPSILDCLQEPFEERPMLDKLNRLEKLGYVPNAEMWQSIRSIRNKFAHDYPDDSEKMPRWSTLPPTQPKA